MNPGSGFLVLMDAEGTVRDGSQLFGPTTGHGFQELKAHVADGNGWIDGGDRIFQRLGIWRKRKGSTDRPHREGYRGYLSG